MQILEITEAEPVRALGATDVLRHQCADFFCELEIRNRIIRNQHSPDAIQRPQSVALAQHAIGGEIAMALDIKAHLEMFVSRLFLDHGAFVMDLKGTVLHHAPINMGVQTTAFLDQGSDTERNLDTVQFQSLGVFTELPLVFCYRQALRTRLLDLAPVIPGAKAAVVGTRGAVIIGGLAELQEPFHPFVGDAAWAPGIVRKWTQAAFSAIWLQDYLLFCTGKRVS